MEVCVYYQAKFFTREVDLQIEDAVGCPSHSSGTGFGERDLQFTVPDADAKEAAKRVRAVMRKLKLKAHVELEPTEPE